MAKKIKHVPSDFSKPKAGVFHKKDEAKKAKPRLDKRQFKPAKPIDKPVAKKSVKPVLAPDERAVDGKMPLNKYVAHCGICSRREAADIIRKGKIKVNSLIETEPGTKVSLEDYILYEGQRIFPKKKLVYYLLNKPKNMITTTVDPEGRHTVMDLFKDAPEPNVFPVGRLDRNTTGLLLLTNDGDLAQKLTHPKYKIKKIYQVVLDKALLKEHFIAIQQGVVLEDGKAPVDELAYINAKNKKEIGIEIHMGKNRIVRRIFESLGYQVKQLDRVYYAGLTKKNLQRGHWRELSTKEIIFLKHYNS